MLTTSSPCNVFYACVHIQCTCKDEEVVAESVDVAEYVVLYLHTTFCKAQDAAFGTSADSAADVCLTGSNASAWQDEVAKWWQLFLQPVNLLLNFPDHGFRYYVALSEFFLARIGSKVTSNDE